jgi:hypothetical protein
MSKMPLPSLLALGLVLLCVPARSQPSQDAAVFFSLDSLQRVIARRILSDADKKEIRACEREKSLALKQCRSGDSAHARVDGLISEAKKTGANPNDPAVEALLEKKFALEKSCDDAFNAQPRGKQCRAGEDKRRKALEKALQEDKAYQRLLEISRTNPAEHS